VDSDAGKWAQYARYSAFPLSWLYKREARLLGKYERRAARASQLCLATTALEVEAIDPEGELPFHALANGVSMPEWVARAVPSEIAALGPYVVFVGQMDYRPNVDAVCYFADEILPVIRQTKSDLKFVVVGRNPTRALRGLGERPGIIVTGTVPEVAPYLQGAIAAVAPFRICQGVQNKILEALAIGLPVVATDRPARAIGGAPSESLLVADSPEAFSRAVIKIINDPLQGRGSAKESMEFVKQFYSWERNLEPLQGWLEEIVNRAGLSGQRRDVGEQV
jgi:glycosyltransferase involved in cell wall biosynthesis